MTTNNKRTRTRTRTVPPAAEPATASQAAATDATAAEAAEAAEAAASVAAEAAEAAATDATDAVAGSDAAEVGDLLMEVSADALDDDSFMDAELAALRAELAAEIDAATDRPDGPCGPARSATEAIRCHWPASVRKAAAEAAVRLPGAFPVRGDGPDLALKLNVSAAFGCKAPKGGPVIPRRSGDVALQGIYRASQRLANGETLSLLFVLTCVEVTRMKCRKAESVQPDWMDHLVATDTKSIGKATSIIYQLAKQSGRNIAITADSKVVAV